MIRRIALMVIAVGVSCMGPLVTPAGAQESPIREWTVPWDESRPRDPYPAPDGRVWFVGQTADYAAWLDPETGKFHRYDLSPGAGPHNVVVAPDGTAWYTGNRGAHIGSIDPATGAVREYPMSNPDAYDPHTLVFDDAGRLWFTVQHGNMVGRFDPRSGISDVIAVPTANARPYGIDVASDGRMWFTEFAAAKLGTVDPASMELTEVVLPRDGARPRRLVVTSDDAVWYVDYAGGFIGRVDPMDGSIEEWASPSGAAARPYGMAVDDQDRVWYVETGPRPNRMVAFDTNTQSVLGTWPIPSGAGSVRHMAYDPRTGFVWFGTDANTIGRVDTR